MGRGPTRDYYKIMNDDFVEVPDGQGLATTTTAGKDAGKRTCRWQELQELVDKK